MTMKTRTHHGWLASAIVSIAAGVLLCAAPAGSQMPQPSIRTLTGTITDAGHEPIRGAVVELRNSRTNLVITYITDTTGQYNFKRLDGNTDYAVWVLFRGRRSRTRSISMFDSHMAKVIDFTVRLY
jgi:hypothetical protein